MATGYGIGQEQLDAAARGMANRRAASQQSSTQALEFLKQMQTQRDLERGRSVGQVAGDSALGLLSGAVGLGQSAYGLGNLATLGTLDRATGGFSQNFGEAQEAIQGWQSDQLNAQRDAASQTFEDEGLMAGAGAYLSNPSLLLDLGMQAAPSLIPTVAAGNIAARTVGAVAGKEAAQKAATTAAVRTAGAQTAGSVNVDAVDTLREQGVDGLEQQLLGVGAGVGAGIVGAGLTRLTGAGALEAAVGSRLAGVGGTGGGVVRGALGGAGREALEEAGQSASETAAVNAVAPENELLQGTGQAAVVGGIAGGILGGPMGAFTGANPQAPADPEVDPAAGAQQQQARQRGEPVAETRSDMFGGVSQWENIAQRQGGAAPEVPAQAAPDFTLGEQAIQGELDLTAEESADFTMGEQMIQAGLLLEDAEGNVTVNPEQEGLFDAANQGMTGEELEAQARARQAMAKRVQDVRQKVRPQIEQAVGVADRANIVEDDLLTSTQARKQEREAREEAKRQELFTVVENDEGKTVYQRYNRDLQRMEQLEYGPATREAKAAIKAENEAAAEAARDPADRWRDWLDQNPELDVRKNSLTSKNKEWQRFSSQANELGIQPESEEAASFLQQMSNELGQDEAGAGKLGAALGTAFPPDTSVEGQAETAATEAAQEAMAQGQDPLPAAQEAADTAAEEALTQAQQQATEQAENQQAAEEQQIEESLYPDAETPAPQAILGRDDTPYRNRKGALNARRSNRVKKAAEAMGVEATDLQPVEREDGTFELRAPEPVVDNEPAAGEQQAESPVTGEQQPAQPGSTAEEVLAQQDSQVEQDRVDEVAQSVQRRVDGYYASNAKQGDSRERFYKREGAKYLTDDLVMAADPEDLELTFEAVKNTAVYSKLDDKQREEVVNAYNNVLTRLTGGAAFMRVEPDDNAVVDYRTAAQKAAGDEIDVPSRSPRSKKQNEPEQAETPLDEGSFTRMLGEYPNAQVHQTVADYKATTGMAAPSDAAGVFDRDGVHVIRENIKTQEHLAEVLAHEEAHQGISSLLGDRLTAVTNRLWANAALRERIKEKMRTQTLDRAVAAEEVLVDMLATNERLTGDVWSKMRSAVQSTFEKLLGVDKYRVTDRQVDALLDDVARSMRGEDVTLRDSGALNESGFLDSLIGKPDAITQDARFSRARDAMDSLVSVRNPAKGNHNDLSFVTREAVDASRKRLRDVVPEVKSGKLGRMFMPFMPLNQMYNMWGRNFETVITNDDGTTTTVNPFADLNTLKGEQEARFNQRLVRKRNMEYNGEQIEAAVLDISDQASDFQLRNPEQAKTLNRVLQESTFFQVWPDKAWADQPRINYQRYNMTDVERKAAYDEINTQWKQMGTEGQALYKKMQASYKDQWKSRIDAMEAELRRVRGIPEGEPMPKVKMLELARRELSAGPYSPLTRHGNYLVIVRSENGVEHYSAYDTQTEAERARVSLAQEYPAQDGFSVARTQQADEASYRAGLNQEQLNALEDAVANALPADLDPSIETSLRESLTEAYLKMIPASSFGQFSNRRRNVSGYSMDGIRAFAEYSMKSARNISSIEYDGRISNALASMQQTIRERQTENLRRVERGEAPLENINTDVEQDVLNHVKGQHEAALRKNFSKLASMLSGAGFLYMMTSPSQLIVNASQTFIIAMPRLGARYGGAKSLRVGNEAIKNFFRTGRDLLSDRAVNEGGVDKGTHSVLQRLFEDGTLDFTFAHDVTDVANGEVGQLRAGWRKSMQFLSKWIHDSEVFNRQVTAYMATKMHAEEAGYDLNNLNAQQLNELHTVAKDAVDSTQFNYSQMNKPQVMQGPIRRLVFQFQQYRLNMMAMMAKDLRDAMGGNNATAEEKSLARKTLAYMLGTQLALTGAAGTALSPIAFAIMDAFGSDDEDFVDSRTEFVNSVPTLLSKGVIGGALRLDPGRVEVGGVLPFLGDRSYAPNTDDFSESAAYYLERNIGPWFGLTTGVAKGVMDMFNGDMYKASQGILPKPAADVLRSIHEMEGVRNKQGVITYDTGVWDSVTRAVGLRSMDEAKARERMGASYQAATNIQRGRQNRLVELAVAKATGDDQAYTDAMERIQEWNRKNPEFAIKGQDIGRLFVQQARAGQNVERFGVPLSRNITPGFSEAATL